MSDFDQVYDVVIIGSGISGAILSKRLAECGRTVLVLEAGEGSINLNERGRELGNFIRALNKFPEAPYDENPNAPTATIKGLIAGNAGGSYLDFDVPTDKHLPFGTTYVRKTGGTMWHWMGTCLRLLPNDFALKSNYGKGVDWPITYDDLGIVPRIDGKSYYDLAEDEIGVSASVRDQDPEIRGKKIGLFRDGREYPMPALTPTVVDQFFRRGVQDMEFDGQPFWVYKTPAGRNSVPYKGRNACAGNTNCVPLCPIGAKYDPSATWREIMDHHHAFVRLKTRCVAAELIHSPDTKEVEGVRFIPYSDASRVSPEAPQTARGRIYVVAAHGIESPKLLLASGMGKINDTIGRNLMDHPFYLRWGLAPEQIYPYRGPLSTAGLDGLRDGDFRKTRAAYRIEIGNDGWALPAGDPTTTVNDLVGKGVYGEALVKQLNDILTHQCRIGFELEQLPDPENRVTLSEGKDALGLRRPKVRYSVSDYENNGFKSALKLWQAVIEKLNIEDFSVNKDGAKFEFMGAGHVMGTCCMGNDPKTAVVDHEQRSHDFKNLFIVGSSVFPTGGTANPTLTIAALAFWAADTIHSQLG